MLISSPPSLLAALTCCWIAGVTRSAEINAARDLAICNNGTRFACICSALEDDTRTAAIVAYATKSKSPPLCLSLFTSSKSFVKNVSFVQLQFLAPRFPQLGTLLNQRPRVASAESFDNDERFLKERLAILISKQCQLHARHHKKSACNPEMDEEASQRTNGHVQFQWSDIVLTRRECFENASALIDFIVLKHPDSANSIDFDTLLPTEFVFQTISRQRRELERMLLYSLTVRTSEIQYNSSQWPLITPAEKKQSQSWLGRFKLAVTSLSWFGYTLVTVAVLLAIIYVLAIVKAIRDRIALKRRYASVQQTEETRRQAELEQRMGPPTTPAPVVSDQAKRMQEQLAVLERFQKTLHEKVEAQDTSYTSYQNDDEVAIVDNHLAERSPPEEPDELQPLRSEKKVSRQKRLSSGGATIIPISTRASGAKKSTSLMGVFNGSKVASSDKPTKHRPKTSSTIHNFPMETEFADFSRTQPRAELDANWANNDNWDQEETIIWEKKETVVWERAEPEKPKPPPVPPRRDLMAAQPNGTANRGSEKLDAIIEQLAIINSMPKDVPVVFEERQEAETVLTSPEKPEAPTVVAKPEPPPSEMCEILVTDVGRLSRASARQHTNGGSSNSCTASSTSSSPDSDDSDVEETHQKKPRRHHVSSAPVSDEDATASGLDPNASSLVTYEQLCESTLSINVHPALEQADDVWPSEHDGAHLV